MYLCQGRPIIEYSGGTEIGGGYITGSLLHNAAPGFFTTPTLGTQLCLMDDHGHLGTKGEVFIMPPALGLSQTLLNADHHEVYYENTPKHPVADITLRRHQDALELTPNGFYKGLGRVDDAMNLGGIKVSASEIEECLATLDWIEECAAIATQEPSGGPSKLLIFAVLGQVLPKPAQSECFKQAANVIKKQLNPLFKLSELKLIDQLPRTSSGKIMRRRLRDSISCCLRSSK